MTYKGKWEAQDRSSPEMKDIGYIGLELNKEVYPYIINIPSPPFALGRCGAIITSDPMNPDGAKANAHLIVTAVNACIKLNPDNPQAVAESISDLCEALKAVEYTMSVDPSELSRDHPITAKMVKEALAKTEGK